MSKSKPKSKAPAFQFYASDFYMDTISWTQDMVGIHIRLMCLHWINGSIEINDLGYPIILEENHYSNFDKIRLKYHLKNGKLFNKRLKKIQEERKEFIKKAVETGMEGALKRWGTPSKPHPRKYRVPHQNPNGVNMGLHTSSSSSIIKENLIKENGSWDVQKKSFLDPTDAWIMNFCVEKKIQERDLRKQMQEFITDRELSEDFKDFRELRRHFTNLFNKQQSIKVNSKNYNNEPSAPPLTDIDDD